MAKKQKKSASTGKAWSGRFRTKTHRLMDAFSSSLSFDRRMYKQDIQGSIAHCKGLEQAGVLTTHEAKAIIRGLERVRAELDKERFPFAPTDEDIHMAVERRLTELIGPVGGKLHTGRSRNDQVALDLRLYLRDALGALIKTAHQFQQALLDQARRHLDVAMPGYTHLQRAQPVLLSHHLLAYVEMVERDKGRMRDVLVRLDEMPLGSGALAGTNYPVDRAYVAQLLGFAGVTQNSLDAVSDRDFAIETLSALAMLIMHLSRLSEELILWSSQEFRFVELPDAFCTGSSMMPQKKNPDVLELIRGKTGRVFGALTTILTVMKGLPLSYNRDLQEDKGPLFDTVDTLQMSLALLARLVPKVHFNADRMRQAAGEGFLLATDLADYLTEKGLPFRQAHHVVGRIVVQGIAEKKPLSSWTLADFQPFSPLFGRDLHLSLDTALSRRAVIGGTALQSIRAALRQIQRP